jgi:hypothetical protein
MTKSYKETKIELTQMMVHNYRIRLGIKKKLTVEFLPTMKRYLGLGGLSGRIHLNEKLLEGPIEDLQRTVVHEMVHCWRAKYREGGPRSDYGHSAAFWRAYYKALRALGIPPDKWHPMSIHER